MLTSQSHHTQQVGFTLPFAVGQADHTPALVAALLYTREQLTRYRYTDGYNHILDRIDAALLAAGIDANDAQERARWLPSA